MKRILASIFAFWTAATPAVAQSIDQEMVRTMAAGVQLSGHECEGMAGTYVGTANDGTKAYIVECRGGDRFVYLDLPGGKVSVVSCAMMRAQGFPC